MTKEVIDIDMLKSAESGKTRIGKANLITYLKGGKITRRESIRAKCFDCNGMGESNECDIASCSLYPYSPYRV